MKRTAKETSSEILKILKKMGTGKIPTRKRVIPFSTHETFEICNGYLLYYCVDGVAKDSRSLHWLKNYGTENFKYIRENKESVEEFVHMHDSLTEKDLKDLEYNANPNESTDILTNYMKTERTGSTPCPYDPRMMHVEEDDINDIYGWFSQVD